MFSKEGGVGTITLNDPQRRNPLSLDTMRALSRLFEDAANDPDVRVVVLTATGSVFSAGHDLREVVDTPLDEQRLIFNTCSDLMQKIQEIPQPVIAAVNGTALAAGCQLVATCDLAVAANNAGFGTPGVKIGLFCSTPMVAVSRAIGRKRSLQMLMTGAVISAETAADWGLINEVVEPQNVMTRAKEIAAQIVETSALTMRVGKKAFYQQLELSQAEAYSSMSEVMATNATTHDAQEGIGAFLEKRNPVWENR